MADDKLEHRVGIALRAAQMKRRIVPAILVDMHERIDNLYEEYSGNKKNSKSGWPIFGFYSSGSMNYDGVEGKYVTDYYRRHHEIAAFLDGLGIPGIKVVELKKLYDNLRTDRRFKELSGWGKGTHLWDN